MNLELNSHSPVLEVITYNEIESPVWLKDGHSGRVCWAISKSKVGSESGSTLLNVRDAAKSSTTGFRYMSQAELKAIQETGYLRGGWSGETYFTKDLYKSAAKAQSRLSLGSSPTLRVEFEILNNPTLLRNGTKVTPLNGMFGGGSEFMTLDPVKVRLINWQPLR